MTSGRGGYGEPMATPDRSRPGTAQTPAPPYTAVIFTSVRTPHGDDDYARPSRRMIELAMQQDGFLGVESARDGLGLTVSYWRDDAAAHAWKQVAEHLDVQQRGRDEWYREYRVRVARVEHEYGSP